VRSLEVSAPYCLAGQIILTSAPKATRPRAAHPGSGPSCEDSGYLRAAKLARAGVRGTFHFAGSLDLAPGINVLDLSDRDRFPPSCSRS
jgi:hypothetical protein